MSNKSQYSETIQSQDEYQQQPPNEDGDRGLFGSSGRPRPSQSQQQYPPQGQQQYPLQGQQQYPPQYQGPNYQQQQHQGPNSQGQYVQQQQQQQQFGAHQNNNYNNNNNGPVEPIRLSLVNPQRPQNGFTTVVPERLHMLAHGPIDDTKWSQFIHELNEILAKAPGTVTNGVADFWLVKIATLGTVEHARDMYKDRVFNKATAVVEKYNIGDFAKCGIAVHLKIVHGGRSDTSDASCAYGKDKKSEKHHGSAGLATLELLVERA